MNAKRKGTRAEHRAMRILEQAGYLCTRAGGSLGVFDVIGLGPVDIRCLSVKSGGKYLSGVEREVLELLHLPPNVIKEVWRFPDRCREPLVERVR